MLGSTIVLAADYPLDDPDSPREQVLDTLDEVFAICFIIEGNNQGNFYCYFLALMGFYWLHKIIAMGFLFNAKNSKKAYIRDIWNVLDFCIIIVKFGMYLLLIQLGLFFGFFCWQKLLKSNLFSVFKSIESSSSSENRNIQSKYESNYFPAHQDFF